MAGYLYFPELEGAQEGDRVNLTADLVDAKQGQSFDKISVPSLSNETGLHRAALDCYRNIDMAPLIALLGLFVVLNVGRSAARRAARKLTLNQKRSEH